MCFSMPAIYSLVTKRFRVVFVHWFMFLYHVRWVFLRLLVEVIVLTMPAKFTPR